MIGGPGTAFETFPDGLALTKCLVLGPHEKGFSDVIIHLPDVSLCITLRYFDQKGKKYKQNPADHHAQSKEKAMDLLATNFIVTGSEAAAAAAEIQKIISEKFHCPVPVPSEEDTEAGKAQVVEIPGELLRSSTPSTISA